MNTPLFEKNSLNLSRMICGSKTAYMRAYPTHKVVFNANIFSEKQGKIWYGDLDLDIDSNNIQAVANELEEDLYILREADGRFENENLAPEEAKKLAVKVYTAVAKNDSNEKT